MRGKGGIMIDESRVVERFMNYVRIGSETHFEGEMSRYLAQELRDLGFEVYVDRAGETVESDGNNVYCFLPGDESFERLMFSSHMDTVTPGNHVEPVIRDGYIVAAGDTILGADDKAGIAAIVEALVTIQENNIPHRPIEAVFTVREEDGLLGAANLEYDKLKAKKAIVLDASDDVGKIVARAPGHYQMRAEIFGKRSHAGSDPEKGVSAVQAAVLGASRMKLQRIDEETTANIGTLSTVGATNVVQDHCLFEAETRSRNAEKLEAQIQDMVRCMKEACDELGARMECKVWKKYDAYDYPDDHPHVQFLAEKCRQAGVKPWITHSGGATDGNVFNAKGITTAVLSCGMEKEHTKEERIAVYNLVNIAKVVLQIMRVDQ